MNLIVKQKRFLLKTTMKQRITDVMIFKKNICRDVCKNQCRKKNTMHLFSL